MRSALRIQASALMLAMMMPLVHVHAAEDDSEPTVETLREDVAKLNQELEDFTTERRERLMTDIEDVLDAIDGRIAALENKLQDGWSKADKLTRAQAQTALASLRRERSRVDEWYQRMQDSADFTWESMKDGFNDAFDTLSEDWQSAEEKVREAGEED
ncbi:hypothetical protein SAMN05216429_10823 [Marinobacter persicus]|uniref:Uncharacterized protein n=1 Tax=Marinobacter persicus TaxID=930118 RepID=A0A1I3VME2_9GAMM|nr:hypothetical protein [Marinobacter persicus]GHD51532.1 hypothetical protein GCM10008110_23360 [Marinobacter persicus]SFJ95427.1 hypothetical protein SAMN05216429_10823 [Marinobacter persicus]